jgi:hypothetical protein
MAIEKRTPEEAEAGINQVENTDTAWRAAHAEKPLRDASRDPEASGIVKESKPVFDLAAEDAGAREAKLHESQDQKEMEKILYGRMKEVSGNVHVRNIEQIGDIYERVEEAHYGSEDDAEATKNELIASGFEAQRNGEFVTVKIRIRSASK